MSDYMDTAHYRVNKFVSAVRALNFRTGQPLQACAGIPLNVGDLEVVVREWAEMKESVARAEGLAVQIKVARDFVCENEGDLRAGNYLKLVRLLEPEFTTVRDTPRSRRLGLEPQNQWNRQLKAVAEAFAALAASAESGVGATNSSPSHIQRERDKFEAALQKIFDVCNGYGMEAGWAARHALDTLQSEPQKEGT